MSDQPKTASLVFFYYGEDSYINRLAQETVPIHHSLTGYDKTVLLRHETDINAGDLKFELSEKAEQKADVLDLPTAANFVKYLDELGQQGYVVDLFIFSHGWIDQFRVSKGTYGDNATITAKYIEAHVKPLKLRMVWGTNCYGSTLNDTWRHLGARVCSGARYVSFYPTQYKNFITSWLDGESYGTCVSKAVTKLIRTPVQIYIPADAATRAAEWGGNVFKAATVLGKTQAAEDYFRACWLDGDEWQEGMSGKQNMNYSSVFLIEGDRSTTKKTVW
jgi:hypothetical protein